MAAQRQLAAIMFTDIEGYTAIMQHDEQRAVALRKRHRSVLEQGHMAANGRIIQFYGDGTLSMFHSAVEAVECALAMQKAFLTDPKVPVRIGIHLGDVIIDADQVFGDGVNLASRIESLSQAGSILISDKVNDEIRNHPDLKTKSMGRFKLKNIRREVEVFAVDDAHLHVPEGNSLTGKTENQRAGPLVAGIGIDHIPKNAFPVKSIAVLPFVNMSNDPEQEYISEGIAEEILNALSNIHELKVAGRASSFLQQNNTDSREIGRLLGVSKVLEGSVRKQGNLLRVSVQLINAEDGYHIWSEKYERSIEDIFAIQDEIAASVSEKLKVMFTGKEKEGQKGRTRNTEAYELYLQGRYHINRRGTAIAKGIECFEQAISLDPNFALAHAGYADANLMAAFYGVIPASKVVHKARESAEKAIIMDPSLCEPYCSLGCYYALFAWNWPAAEKNFIQSIELNPKYAQGHAWYGLMYLAWVKGDFENAEYHGRTAIQIDPLNAVGYSNFGSILHAAGKFHEALAACKTSIELDPRLFVSHIYEGLSWLSLHQYEKAIFSLERATELSAGHHLAQNALAIAYATVWRFDKARKLYDELAARPSTQMIGAAVTGLTAAHLEYMDQAYDLFNKALEQNDPMLLTFKHEDWVPDSLRIDPPFQSLLKKIGFPEHRKQAMAES